MHKRSLSPSTISGTESEPFDEPVARERSHRRLEMPTDEDDVFLFVKPSTYTLTSNEHDLLPTSNQAALQHVDSLAKSKPQNVPHQPPHPRHIPSFLDIAQTNALIADQEIKIANLNAELGKLVQQRDAAAQAVRNYRAFIAGKCLSWECCRTMDSCTLEE